MRKRKELLWMWIAAMILLVILAPDWIPSNLLLAQVTLAETETGAEPESVTEAEPGEEPEIGEEAEPGEESESVTETEPGEEAETEEESVLPDISITGTQANDSGWYTSEVTVLPPEGFLISADISFTDNSWEDSVTLTEDGVYSETAVYLRNAESGAVSEAISLGDICIDQTAPTELSVEYAALSKAEQTETELLYGGTGGVQIVITAKDAVSGIAFYEYSIDGGESWIRAETATEQDGAMTGMAVIENEYEGSVPVRAFDTAGNYAELTDCDRRIIVDTTAPEISVSFDRTQEGTYHFYSDGVKAVIQIREKYFDAAEATVTVGTGTDEVSNGGEYAEERVFPEFVCVDEEHCVYQAEIDFSDEADYKLCVTCTDASGNEAGSFSDTFTVDLTEPVIGLDYDNNEAQNDTYFQGTRTAVITVTEHNFDASGVTLSMTAEDAADEEALNCFISEIESKIADPESWEEDGDAHIFRFTFTEDAAYSFCISCTDKAGRSSPKTDTVLWAFTLDNTVPTLKIVISPEGNGASGWNWDNDSAPADTVTFARWSSMAVTAEITVEDATSDLARVRYYKVDSAVTIDELTEEDIWDSISDTVEGKKASAKGIVMPDERFIVYVYAADKAGNEYWISSEGIIVDASAPQSADNGAPIITVTGGSFRNDIFNSDVPLTITVEDPRTGADQVYSGIGEVRCRILKDGEQTNAASELLYSFQTGDPGLEDLLWNWSTQVVVDSALNNSNDVAVEVTVTDNAGNCTVEFLHLQIDVTAPEITVSYDNNAADSGRYFKEDRTATISVRERNFDAADVILTVTNTDGGTPVFSGWTDSGSGDDTVWTGYVVFDQDGDYALSAAFTDMAGNAAESIAYIGTCPREFTIDKTQPVIAVSYDNNDALNGNYYAQPRQATVTVTEHNFDPDRVNIRLTAADDGNLISVPAVNGWITDGDVHTAYIHYDYDGFFTFDMDVTDKAGLISDDFEMQSFYVDMTAPSLKIIGVENLSANRGDVIPTVIYSDTNFDRSTVSIRLFGANRGAVALEGSYISAHNGQSFVFNDFARTKEADDIYTLTAELTDLAGNSSTEQISFSVNRYGSAYDLSQVQEWNGRFVRELPDLVVYEVNPDVLTRIIVTVFQDGKAFVLQEGSDYEVTVTGGNGSWYRYAYRIFKENFEDDGIYRISFYSEDRAGNAAENSQDTKGAEVVFGVDRTAPNLIVTNLESNTTYPLEKLTVFMRADDNLKLAAVKAELDGAECAFWTGEELEAILNVGGDFTFDISGDLTSAHSAVITCTDAAGNEAVTVIENFYVTTDLWTRYYTNKPLLWYSLTGGAALIGLFFFLILFSRRKKKR